MLASCWLVAVGELWHAHGFRHAGLASHGAIDRNLTDESLLVFACVAMGVLGQRRQCFLSSLCACGAQAVLFGFGFLAQVASYILGLRVLLSV